MLNKIIPAAIVATTLFLPLAGHAASYSGNGASGFGGSLGNGNLTLTSTATAGGTVTFTLNNAGAFSGNDVVVYIDSQTGGFSDTSSFSDNGDGGREAVSGYNAGNPSRSLVTFASGFTADYALEFENDTYDGLFQLVSGGNNSLNYVTGNGPSTNGGPYVVTVTDANLGLTPGQSFNFVASLVSTTAYRSDETIGNSTTIPDTGAAPNGGFNGSVAFSNFDTYSTVTSAPEPGECASLLIGVSVLGGTLLIRRRRAIA